MIDHIFFDLDGTLIGSFGDVKPSVWDAIAPLRGRVGMSVCTGRPRAGIAQRVAQKLAPDGLHIFESGGMVAPPDGAPALTTTLDMFDLVTIAAASKSLDVPVEFYTSQGIFVAKQTEDGRTHARAIEVEVQEADLAVVAMRTPVIRAHWIARAATLDAVLAVPLLGANLSVASSPVLPELVFVSVTNRRTSKGTAAAELASRVGVSLADCAGIGDAVGDLPLLEEVGHPYVVANAPAELVARFEVLGDVDEEGVEPLLRRLQSQR